jgi:DNA-binding transcriptional MerR regulator
LEKYFTAKEIVALLQLEGDSELSIRTVRYYTHYDDMLPPLEMVNNKPKYTQKHVEYIRAIRTMKKTGESLEGIKSTLNSLDYLNVAKIGAQSSYLSSNRLLQTSTHDVNTDVSITFSIDVPVEKQKEAIQMLKSLFEN